MKRPGAGGPVLVTRDGRSGAFLGDDGEGDPGTGGLFVYEMYDVPLSLTVAQVLVEYAEQGFSTAIVDDGSPETGEILYHVAHMLGLRDPEDLSRNLNGLSLAVLGNLREAWSAIEGFPTEDFSYVGGFSIAYHPSVNEPDDHACDMGDAMGALLVMTYPNLDSRTLRTRENDLELGPHGRLVNKT